MVNPHCKPPVALALAFALAVCLWPAERAAAQPLEIERDNIVVNESIRIKPGQYHIEDTDGSGVIQIRSPENIPMIG